VSATRATDVLVKPETTPPEQIPELTQKKVAEPVTCCTNGIFWDRSNDPELHEEQNDR